MYGVLLVGKNNRSDVCNMSCVVDATRRPLMPCRPARARRLLTQHQAAVLRRYPFTIILATAKPEAVVVPLRLKIDPGSRTTGLALVSETP